MLPPSVTIGWGEYRRLTTYADASAQFSLSNGAVAFVLITGQVRPVSRLRPQSRLCIIRAALSLLVGAAALISEAL